LLHLRLDHHLVFRALILVDRLLGEAPEECLALLPLLLLYVELVLEWLRIDDVCEHRQFLVHIQILQGVHYDLPVLID
jgi:hypothetical protein